jgi:hypothetical protein
MRRVVDRHRVLAAQRRRHDCNVAKRAICAWAWPDDLYMEELQAEGFEAEAVTIAAVAEDMPTYTVFLATRPSDGR